MNAMVRESDVVEVSLPDLRIISSDSGLIGREKSMTLVVVLAIAGLIALIAAVLTGTTWIATVVVVLAALGIILLLRDWRNERVQASNARDSATALESAAATVEVPPGPVRADSFKPDISTDPDGPSSDARAD